MNKKILVSILAVAMLAFVHPAEAQQPKKIPRIGMLVGPSSSFFSTRMDAFVKVFTILATAKEKTL